MKKLLLPLLLFISSIPSFSQSSFHKSYDVGGDDFGNKVIGTTQGIFVAGSTNNRGPNNYDQYLMKLDTLGNVQWQTQFGGAQSDAGRSVIPFQGGAGYLIAGNSQSTSPSHNNDVLLSLVEASGTYQGSLYMGYDSLSEVANDIISIGDTDFVIIGTAQSNTDGNHTNMFVMRMNKEASPIWGKTYGSPTTNSTGLHVFATPFGMFGIGTHEPGGPNMEGYVVNFNDTSGAIENQLLIGRPFYDDGRFFTVGNNAIIFGGVAGSIGGPNRSNIMLMAIQPDGDTLRQAWAKTYGGDTASSLAFLQTDTLDGNLIVGGHRFRSNPDLSFGTIIFKVNAATGDIMWSKTLDVTDDQLSSGIILEDGSIVVSGTTKVGLVNNVIVARLSNNGDGCGTDISIEVRDITDDSITGPSIPTLRDSAVVFPMNMVPLDSLGHSVTELNLCLTTAIRTITSKGNTINIYPNPTSGQLFVSSSTGWNSKVKMNVYDVLGSVVFTKNIEANTKDFNIDLSGKAKGMYIISFNDGTTVSTHKITLN